jgi:hypothetical protein
LKISIAQISGAFALFTGFIVGKGNFIVEYIAPQRVDQVADLLVRQPLALYVAQPSFQFAFTVLHKNNLKI